MVNRGDLISCDSTTDHIYIHSGISSTLTGSFATPDSSPGDLCITSDGNLISVGNTSNHFFIHQGISSTLTGSFASPGTTPYGVTLDSNGNLITSDTANPCHIYIHSGISSTLTGSFQSKLEEEVTKLPYGLFFSGGNLYSIQEGLAVDINKHSGISSEYLGSITPVNSPLGLCFYNDILLLSDVVGTDHIYSIDGFSNTIIGSFASPGTNPRGIIVFETGNFVNTIQVEDTLTLSETINPIYSRLAKRTFTQQVEDTLTLTEDISINHIVSSQVFTQSIEDTLTFSENVDVSYVGAPRTFTQSIEDTLTLTEDVTVVHTSKSKQIFTVTVEDTLTLTESISKSFTSSTQTDTTNPIKTKLTIGGVEYSNYTNMKVTRSISDYNSSSSFSILLPSPYGRHKTTFSIGDEVIIYADTSLATTKLITGIIEKIKFSGEENSQDVTITGRDYSARLQDVSILPTVYTDSEVSSIVNNIMVNFVSDVTTNNLNVTTTTLQRKSFRHVSVFDALSELAELSNFSWYVDEDKDLHFEEKNSINSGYIFSDDNNNIYSTNLEETREGMVNDVWVYGDKYLAGYQETLYSGSPVGGSVLTLINRPHNTYIEYLGNPLKGGVFELTTQPVSGIDYLVNYFDREIIFVSGVDWGYSSIPISGGSVFINYDREIPIVRHKTDQTSITNYGRKVKVIQDSAIKDPTTAEDLANKEILKSDPLKGLEMEIRGWADLTPGNTCTVKIDDFNVNQTLGIISIDYTFDKRRILNKRVIKLKLDKKILDITDQIKELSRKIKSIESKDIQESQTITRYLEYNVSGLVVGSYYAVSLRTIGSSFILGHTYNGVLGSPAPSQVAGQVSLGDSRSALSVQVNGSAY